MNLMELLSRLVWPWIIQGGMGIRISLENLASAVANEGGVGVIAAAGIGLEEPDALTNYVEANIRALQKSIRAAKEMTSGILGVNIMVALSNYADMVRTAIEEKIDIIFSGAGLPGDLPDYRPESSETLLVPIVSSGRAARILCQKWLSSKKKSCLPDAFVVEGPCAGGHLGFKAAQLTNSDFCLENLLVEVALEIAPFEKKFGCKIPLIAAGGIYTGQDILDLERLEVVSAVQMATRFVTTYECDASLPFKDAYLRCDEDDLRIIESPVGLPGRAIGNKFLDDVSMGLRKPFKCPYHCIKTCKQADSPYCIALALINAKLGKLRKGFAFAGKNAYRAQKIISVKETMSDIRNEYFNAKYGV